jgi:AcrR family transcriptional regulator
MRIQDTGQGKPNAIEEMSPRPKIDHLRKPQIIAAAAEVLYERGLFETRIGDIAKRAGTSSPTILYYFESKDRLLEEAVEYADREFYDRLTEGQHEFERASDKLVHLIEETALGPGGLNDYTLWMEIWVRARRDPAVRKSYFRLDRRQRTLIADIVRDGQQAGEFGTDADPDDFALALSGLMDGLGVQVTLGQPDVTAERMVDRCLALASSELGCEMRPFRDDEKANRKTGATGHAST